MGRPTGTERPGACRRREALGEACRARTASASRRSCTTRTLDAEPDLLEAVTAAAALALQNDRLQAELRAEVSFVSTVTNTAPSLLVTIGTDGRVRTINAAALEAAGYDDEARRRGQHYWDLFIEPAEREAMIARFHALAPGLPAGEYENTFTNARDEVRTIYWRAAPVKDAAGNVISIVSGGLDITERRKRELELERERDATTTALEAIPSIAIVLDRDGDDPRPGCRQLRASARIAPFRRRSAGATTSSSVGRSLDLDRGGRRRPRPRLRLPPRRRWRGVRGGRVGAPLRRR